jgi:hypothetical protein
MCQRFDVTGNLKNIAKFSGTKRGLVEYLESFASSVMDWQTEISKSKISTILSWHINPWEPFAETSGRPPPQEDVRRLVPLHCRREAVVPNATRWAQRGSVWPAQEAAARSPDEPLAAGWLCHIRKQTPLVSVLIVFLLFHVCLTRGTCCRQFEAGGVQGMEGVSSWDCVGVENDVPPLNHVCNCLLDPCVFYYL